MAQAYLPAQEIKDGVVTIAVIVRLNAATTITTGNMVFRADNDGTGPEASAAITCVASCLTVTTGALNIWFNPVSYASTSSEILTYGSNAWTRQRRMTTVFRMDASMCPNHFGARC